ncbi:hypothetical protein IQ07DRAFT_681968 [Pyrenochaeta sp. DS3sAY3a]|nr:hypothetical protein IQ07DRAFT_681968 [Pyrenochaeta sp. DS3sAY3a]
MYKASNLLVLLFIVLAALPSHVLGFACSTRSNVTLVHTLSNPQLGNANNLQHGEALPWPKSGKYRPIRYCYANDETQRALGCSHISPALTVWARVLGSPAGPVTGHSVAYRQASDPLVKTSPPKYLRCYGEQYKSLRDTGPWNMKVPPDTLAIHISDELYSASSIGYTPGMWDNTPGRHYMHVNPENQVHTIVHEFGHVLGMIHEHNRDDRDEYLVYRCEKLLGFDDALAWAIEDGVEEAVARKKLCDEQRFATKYEFDGCAYTKNEWYHDRPGYFDEDEFDIDSIMMYPTTDSSNVECNELGIDDECPLMKIDKVDGKNIGTLSRISQPEVPSAGDVAFVKKYYPWFSPSPSSSSSPLPPPTKKIRRTVSVSEVQVDASTRWRVTRTLEREEGGYVAREEDEHVVGDGQGWLARGEKVQPVEEEKDQAEREEQGQLGRKEGA